MSKNKHFEEDIDKNDIPFDAETEETSNEEQATEASSESEEEEDIVDKLETELAELKDKYLRQVAEFDNYRKRTLKEKAELILNGGEKVISSLLPVLDDFERAEQNLEKSDDIEALKEGVILIFQKLLKTLKSQGLEKMETEGQDFNTDFHEAIAMIPATSDEQKGKVIDCVQTGYTLNDKVLRHAKVAIGQ